MTACLKPQTLYQALDRVGVDVRHDGPDLFAKRTPIAGELVRASGEEYNTVLCMYDDTGFWYRVPGAYDPWFGSLPVMAEDGTEDE